MKEVAGMITYLRPRWTHTVTGSAFLALLISPYARRGYIDNTQLDHTSNLKFIEETGV